MKRGPGYFARSWMQDVPENERAELWVEAQRIRRERRWYLDILYWIWLVAFCMVLLWFATSRDAFPVVLWWASIIMLGLVVPFFIAVGFAISAQRKKQSVDLAKKLASGFVREDVGTGSMLSRMRANHREQVLLGLHPALHQMESNLRWRVVRAYGKNLAPLAASRAKRRMLIRSFFISAGVIWALHFLLAPITFSLADNDFYSVAYWFLGLGLCAVIYGFSYPLPSKEIIGTPEEYAFWTTVRRCGVKCCTLCGSDDVIEESEVCKACDDARWRDGANVCVGCGYDLKGIEQVDRCPECGHLRAIARKWKLTLWDKVRGRV